jgi:hypothetical protein
MRKQHNFKVGDEIQSPSGLRCTVERIDPACNNVYGKNFSNSRPNGDEISSPRSWTVIKPADGNYSVTTARDFIDADEKFEVTILQNITSDDPFSVSGFGAQFVHRATVDKRNQSLSYPAQVREYLQEVGPTLANTPDKYIAIAVYGDDDTICVKFSTEKIEQPIVVKFDTPVIA